MTSCMPNRLGVSLRDGGVNVAVVSRHAERIHFCLFDEAGQKEMHRFALVERLGDVHCGFIDGIETGARYGLRAEGPWDPSHGHRFDPAKLLIDPYAKRLDRPFTHHDELRAPRSAAIDTAAWVPKAIVTAPLSPAEKLPHPRPQFIYEIAIRAFTQRHPGIPENIRGTASAIAHPAVIGHLKKLGVDTVELMPVAAWIDERHLPALGLHNAWGYNPVVFMAPDPRLAPGGVDELRAAAAALHEADMRVLLDVVFNHTGESDVFGTTLSLRGLDNALYYRHAPDDPGRLVNDTGCGNTLALDRPPVMRLVMDAMRHWAEVAGIDGFRFDLATVLGRTDRDFNAEAPLLAAIEQDPLLSKLTLIAEPWDVGPQGYRLGGFPPRWHEWNDRYRDEVRRFWRGDEGSLGAMATRLAGSSDIFGQNHRRPSASVNYVAAHDGFTLRDAVGFAGKRNEANGEGNRDGKADEISWVSDDPARDVRNMLATLFFSRGLAMLTAGDEFGRTQNGNNNAYAQDNETTWLDWDEADQSLGAFVAELARLRKAHPALIADRFLTDRPDNSGLADATWIRLDGSEMSPEDWARSRAVGLLLHADGDRVLIRINGGSSDLEFALPPPREGWKWVREFSTSARSDEISGQSVALFAEERSRATGVSDDMIQRLAGEAGIDREWWEVDGTHHTVSPETLRAVLAAMRLPASTRSEAEASLARLTAERKRALPRTLVLRADEAAVLPGGRGPRRRVLHVASDEGEERRIEFAPGNDDLALPALSMGYYRCRFDDAPDAGCRLIVAPGGCFLPDALAGAELPFGFAAHLYALRRDSDRGIGDFDTLARFGEASAKAGGIVAGINPLHHMFPSDRERASPYQPSDRRFLDPIYIDIGNLPAGGRITRKQNAAFADLSQERYVDYPRVWEVKSAILRTAFGRFSSAGRISEFAKFDKAGGSELERHAIFETLAAKFGTKDRAHWPKEGEIPGFAAEHRDEIRYHAWLQWVADRQFAEAAARARAAGLTIGFYRDLALGTAFDGGEIWANPQSFAEGVSIGAPPDPFAREGQVWNLPPYSPLALGEKEFAPCISVLASNMRHAGALRIDHILGYARQFWVPRGAPGADGAYVRFPAETLIAITALESHRHRCAVIGEDLGTVPEGLRGLLAQANILSYRVLWFERDGVDFKAPSTYPRLSTSCLSSHDLPTFMGWRRSASDEEVAALNRAIESEGIDPGKTDDDALAAVHEFIGRTGSALMLVQVDDLEGETEPLNVPGTDRERPNWRRRNRGNVEGIGRRMPVIEAVKRGRGR
jgi:glycogen debranching enzyme GlgX/4-alpha-glucanotransferase